MVLDKVSRALLVKLFYQNNNNSAAALREYRRIKGIRRGPLSAVALKNMIRKFELTGDLGIAPGRGRRPVTPQIVEEVTVAMAENAGRNLRSSSSARAVSRQLNIPWSTVRKVLRTIILLDCGADPSVQNDRGETALHEALERDAPGSLEAVTLLASAGTDLSRYTSYRETPLHLASRKNRPAIVAMLLNFRAPPNAQDLRGNTALHLAAGKGYHEVCDEVVNSQVSVVCYCPEAVASARKLVRCSDLTRTCRCLFVDGRTNYFAF
ncbi:hypothetical protein C0J52_14647 [Blattella germanica]|nr:hypothetical protein C0J52_14647 [Blattella germanica]